MGSFAVIVALSGQLSLACINTTYSREDELVITDNLGHLVIGAFAHHGPAFYEKEVGRCLAILDTAPDDFDARNDLGAAHTKLGEWSKARAAFEENERRHPGKYKTASNLGVMYKKMGKFKEAAEWIAKSLEIKPGGHMGLGDYYLKMIQWRSRGEHQSNFLGVRYDAGPEATAAAANREFVITLIKNDVGFGDAYIVLGDIFFVEQDYQLALRAYLRAQDLENYYASDRTNRIARVWRSQAQPGYVVEHNLGRDQIQSEFESAKRWVEKYQQIESDRLDAKQGVTFAEMQVALSQRGIQKPQIVEAAHYRGSENGAEQSVYSFPILFAGAAAIAIFLLCTIVCLVVVRLLFFKPKQPIQWTSELKIHPPAKLAK